MRQSDINSCRDNNSFNYNGVATELLALATLASSLSQSTPSTTTRESEGKSIFSPERPVTWTLLISHTTPSEYTVSNTSTPKNIHTANISKTLGNEEIEEENKQKKIKSELTKNL